MASRNKKHDRAVFSLHTGEQSKSDKISKPRTDRLLRSQLRPCVWMHVRVQCRTHHALRLCRRVEGYLTGRFAGVLVPTCRSTDEVRPRRWTGKGSADERGLGESWVVVSCKRPCGYCLGFRLAGVVFWLAERLARRRRRVLRSWAGWAGAGPYDIA